MKTQNNLTLNNYLPQLFNPMRLLLLGCGATVIFAGTFMASVTGWYLLLSFTCVITLVMPGTGKTSNKEIFKLILVLLVVTAFTGCSTKAKNNGHNKSVADKTKQDSNYLKQQLTTALSLTGKGEYDKAMSLYNQIEATAKKTAFHGVEIESLLGKGRIIFYQGYVDSAANFFNQCRESSLKYNYPFLLRKAISNLGACASNNGKHEAGVAYFLEALKLAEEQKDSVGAIFMYNNIGIEYNALNEPDNAIIYLTKGIEEIKNKDDSTTSAFLEINLGKALFEKKRYTESISHGENALLFGVNTPTSLIYSSNLLAENYLELKQIKKAIFFQQRSLNQSLLIKDPELIAYMKAQLSKCYAQTGQADSALALLEDVKHFMSDFKSSREHFLELYLTFATAYKGTGNFKDAYIYLKKGYDLSDSLKEKEKKSRVNELLVKYESTKKNQHILELLNAAKIQKFIIWSISGLTLMALLAVVAGFRANKLRKNLYHQKEILLTEIAGSALLREQLAVESDKRAKAEKELAITEQERLLKQTNKLEVDLLNVKMSPHFLFNTLNSIKAILMTGTKKDAAEMLTDLAGILQFSLYDSQQEAVRLQMEIEMCRQYLSLVQIRNEWLQVSFDIKDDESIPTIAPFTLFTLTENAVKYSSRCNPAFIHISFIAEKGALTFIVKNNFDGSNKAPEIYSGLGLKTLKERLRYLYQNRSTLNTTTDLNTFTAIFTLCPPTL